MERDAAAPPTHAVASRSGWLLLAAGVALLLPMAFSPASTAPSWLPKTATLLGLVPILLVAMVVAATDRAVRVGAAFVACAVVAALLSTSPALSMVGPYATGTSVALFVGVVGLYAVGRLARDGGDIGLVERALLAAVALNSVLALLQARLDLSSYGLQIVESRSAALMGNPVHLATLLACGAPLVWHGLRRRSTSLTAIALAVLLAAAAQVSGSRFLLIGLAVGAVWTVARHHDRAALVFAASIVVGLTLGAVAGDRQEFAGASDRISQVGVAEGSTLQRLYTWREALPTFIERPLLGFGPGRYLQATVRHRSAALAKAGPDSYFADAHNLVVEVAVGSGALGILALGSWLVLAIRGARGPFLWSSLALLAMHLVEPTNPATTPLIGLTLGLSAVQPLASKRLSAAGRSRLAVVATLVGVLGGGLLLVGDVRLQRARLDGDRAGARRAAAQLPPWPEVSDAVARIVIFDAVVDRDDRLWAEGAQLERRAVDIDRSDPRWWVLAGLVEDKAGQTARAEASFRAALRLNPWSCGAWGALGRLGARRPERIGAAQICTK